MTKPVTKSLIDLYGKNRTVAMVLDHFAERAKNQWRTKLDVIFGHLSGLKDPPSRGEIVEAFRELEHLGIGEFKVGRRGHPSRFEWAYKSCEVGRAAAGDQDAELELLPDEERLEDSDAILKSHRFALRRDLEVEFALPVDLTSQEAERLATFLRALPLG